MIGSGFYVAVYDPNNRMLKMLPDNEQRLAMEFVKQLVQESCH